MKNPPFIAQVPYRNQTARFTIWGGILLVHLLLSINVWANVYPTNIRFNDGATNVTGTALTNVNISYILNEPATNVTITINSGAATVRTINLTNPTPGTLRGTNLVTWDGKDTNGVAVGNGNYTFSITAKTDGYEDWTQISDDANPGNYVWEGRGIAVNKNPSSPYYGRVFVANSHAGPNEGFRPGDTVGILKLNADGSPADETVESGFWNTNGGWNWAGDYRSPWKIEVSADDKVYVNDLTANGIVLSFDQTVSAASRQMVLNTNNYPSTNLTLGGLFITGTGSGTQVWMADNEGQIGIHRWPVSTNGLIATNELGTTIVKSGPGSDLDTAPFDVAVDGSNRIYTIQQTQVAGDSIYRVFRFPAYGGTIETNADWKIGNSDDDLSGAQGIAVDPTGRYLAVAFIGIGQFPNIQFGSTRIFDTTNGTLVTALIPSGNHFHEDVAWDNVGNVYTIDNFDSTWRTYSPPGTNQATTVASLTIQIQAPTPITLTSPSKTGTQFQFTLNGEPDVSYIIQASTNLLNWDAVVTNVSANASRVITVSAPGTVSFYRALVGQ